MRNASEQGRRFHRESFGESAEQVVTVPGVMALLGEHCEPLGGRVLRASLPWSVTVAVSKRSDNSLRFVSDAFRDPKKSSLSNLKFKREDRWANYLKGVLSAIHRRGFVAKGLNFSVTSDLPYGRGLGSSTAMVLAATIAVRNLFDYPMPDFELIRCGAEAEKLATGHGGIVSEYHAAMNARPDAALLYDGQTRDTDRISWEDPEYSLLLIDSQVPISDVWEDLPDRVDSCLRCLEYAQRELGIRDVQALEQTQIWEDFDGVSEGERRRFEHYVGEEQRIDTALGALARRDGEKLGKTLSASHESLRDLFEVSCPEIDWIVRHLMHAELVAGARITGLGSGGCVAALAPLRNIPAIRLVLNEYERIFGFRANLRAARAVEREDRVQAASV